MIKSAKFPHKKANESHSCNTQYIYLSIPLNFLSNTVLYLQITLRLFGSRVFLCKADMNIGTNFTPYLNMTMCKNTQTGRKDRDMQRSSQSSFLLRRQPLAGGRFGENEKEGKWCGDKNVCVLGKVK